MNEETRAKIPIGPGQYEIISGFCIECRWVKPFTLIDRLTGTARWDLAKCLAPRQPIDLVTGKRDWTYCSIERSIGQCGRPGHWFEPKP